MTPDPTVKVSKRQFDKEIREWRRKLHAFDDVIFDQKKQQTPKELTPEQPWSYREWSKSSSVSSDAHTKNSMSPEMDPNYVLRKRIEGLVLKNHMCMERLQKQNLLISHLLEMNYGRRIEDDLEPLHTLDRFDDFRSPTKPWEKGFSDPYETPSKPYRPWEDDRYAEEPTYRPWMDSRFRDPVFDDHSDRQTLRDPEKKIANDSFLPQTPL